MRHYVPQKYNPYRLPHNLYMQMLYVIRDFDRPEPGEVTESRRRQHLAVSRAAAALEADYEKRPDANGALNGLQAFFDYAYYSFMFMQKSRELGAGKRSWNLYRCRLACITAEYLGLFKAAAENRPGG